MVKAGASDHSLIRLTIVCCVNLFSRRSFIAPSPFRRRYDQAGFKDKRLPARPQSDCGAKSQPCIHCYMAAGNVDELEKQDCGENF
jgi:hypothetical protein